ncbi:MAG: hypothetical protein JNJ46_08740 [Myxococcales bacterium]|nr:hypothetical protein [Myxococcales bacterium]
MPAQIATPPEPMMQVIVALQRMYAVAELSVLTVDTLTSRSRPAPFRFA